MTDVLGRLTATLAGRYHIERELGQGGMATVYLAHDVRHARRVALKVLRPELSAILGGERFVHEIRTTANLQHPHILSLFDSGEADGLVYYVMPFVEGESLRDRLTREKQLPVDDAIRIAREVADALHYAHTHGVVHRDIKPENILLQGGHALVADFGIALAASKSEGATRMTETGMSLGTPYYMAPEQAMGEREITPRADIYALGCVLYEMLTAEPPFVGATAQAIIARVMTEEPRSLTLQRKTIPLHVEEAVECALQKLPADRFASAADFAAALEGRSGAATQRRTVRARSAGPPVRRSALTWAGVTAALILAAGLAGRALGVWSAEPPPGARPVAQFNLALSQPRLFRGEYWGPGMAFTGDGSRLVFVAEERLFVRGLDRREASPIAGTEGAGMPSFSPDGRSVLFTRNRSQLFRVLVAGGPAQRICESSTGGFAGAAWTMGDTIIFGTRLGLYDVPAAGGAPRLIAPADSGERFSSPDLLPDQRHVVFTVVRRSGSELAILDRRRGTVQRLAVAGGSPRYVDGGFLVYVTTDGLLVAVPLDPRALRVTGGPVTLAEGLEVYDGNANFAVSRAGDFAYPPTNATATVALLNRRGEVTRTVSDSGPYFFPRFSPDGRRLVVLRNDRSGPGSDVWLIDLARGTRSRITSNGATWWPAWSPDGRWLVVSRTVDGSTNFGAVARIPLDGSGEPVELVTGGRWSPWVFDRSGALIFYGYDSATANGNLIRRMTFTPAVQWDTILVASPYLAIQPVISPDGRWMAYTSTETGAREVFVRPYPGPGGALQVSDAGGNQPLWPNSGEIIYRNGEAIMSARVSASPTFSVLSRSELFRGAFGYNFDVSADGSTFAVTAQPAPKQEVSVTLNWFDQLRSQRRRGSRL